MLLLPVCCYRARENRGRVVVAGCVAKERSNTVAVLHAAGCVASRALEIPDWPCCRRAVSCCKAVKSASLTLSGVAVRDSLRPGLGLNRSRCRRKRKAGEHERDEKESEPQRRPAD